MPADSAAADPATPTHAPDPARPPRDGTAGAPAIPDAAVDAYIAASNQAYRHPDGPREEIRAGLAAAAPHLVIAELGAVLAAHNAEWTGGDDLDLDDRLAFRIAEIATSPRPAPALADSPDARRRSLHAQPHTPTVRCPPTCHCGGGQP